MFSGTTECKYLVQISLCGVFVISGVLTKRVFCASLQMPRPAAGVAAQLGLTAPPGIWRGYPTFVISILFIGGNTAIIGDVAGHLGCFIYLKDGVNAIAFVALGTSVPGRLGPGRPARS